MIERRISCLGPHGFHPLVYAAWGEGAGGVPVICVHGLTRNGRDFDALAARLARRCRVLCPDMPGRGRSPWLAASEDYGYPLYMADATALIATLGVDEVDWIGTSMGGIIGMLLASLPGSPIRRLVLNDIGPFIPKAALERLGGYVGGDPRFADLGEVEAYLRRVHAPFGPLTDAQWRHLAVHGHRGLADGGFALGYDPAIGDALKGEMADVEFWASYDRISCPTLVLRGTESDLLPAATAQEMTRRGPGAELWELPGIGHAPALMDDEQIARVEAFLDGA